MTDGMAAGERLTVFSGARVVVTGGLGFIGSTLVRRLLALGSDVVVLDALLPGSGANPWNLDGVSGARVVERCDLRDAAALRPLLAGCRFLFNLAGQTSHQDSMSAPLVDLDINSRAQLGLLDACRTAAPRAIIVFASTRQIYGRPDYLPVDEKHPIRPVDVNGVNKAAAESFHLLYRRVYGLRCCALRLTNTYGPRMRIADARQGFLGVWLRAVLEGRPFEVWGGEQLRDFIYVDDVVDAFLAAGVTPAASGRALNIAGGAPVTLRRLAELMIAANDGGSYEMRSFPEARQQIDIGDYCGDDRAFRSLTGWTPRIGLGEGLRRSLAFFRAHLPRYRDAA